MLYLSWNSLFNANGMFDHWTHLENPFWFIVTLKGMNQKKTQEGTKKQMQSKRFKWIYVKTLGNSECNKAS